MCSDRTRLEQERAAASQRLYDEMSNRRLLHDYQAACQAVIDHLAGDCQECQRERWAR